LLFTVGVIIYKEINRFEKIVDIKDLRREYLHGGLSKDNLLGDPLKQFNLWLEQAVNADLSDPTAMTLATVDQHGQPSQRVVLLKHADENGFVFYTNLGSRKAKEIAKNNQVSLHFAWLPLDRQIKIQGIATPLTKKEAFQYFTSRPRDSQLAAWSSQQSRALTSRQVLEHAFLQMKNKFKQGDIPLPDFWGGYRVKISRYEFWQGRENRLHDCFAFNLKNTSSWEIERLAP